ncbi:bacterial regulatory s, lacI family protein [Collimonas fungivorans]|uniref:Bacterial regulatory s, lacI family protein n=1 Tax=Collimonas fungivorans TaxID=158899 RepID=A0A127P5W5_9BURK|nr:bacterial regulatory s, lacI family protein [Collimonas fungivorans]
MRWQDVNVYIAGCIMRPSIKQVALEANVSIAIASRLLNQPDSVSVDTAGKVSQAIEALGFRPNFTGCNQRACRSHTDGVVVSRLLLLTGLRNVQLPDGRSKATCAYRSNIRHLVSIKKYFIVFN